MTDINRIKRHAEAGFHIHPDSVLELIARLEAAEREISAQNKQLAAKDEWIATASARLEAAEKDAARYRWIKDSVSFGSVDYQDNMVHELSVNAGVSWAAYTHGDDVSPLSFDEAVDAEMKEMK